MQTNVTSEETRKAIKIDIFKKVKERFNLGMCVTDFMALEQRLRELLKKLNIVDIQKDKEVGFCIVFLVFLIQIKEKLEDSNALSQLEKFLGLL